VAQKYFYAAQTGSKIWGIFEILFSIFSIFDKNAPTYGERTNLRPEHQLGLAASGLENRKYMPCHREE
jgi:hypothetical protein